MTRISIVNHAKAPLGVDLDKLIGALQAYVKTCIVPTWGAGCDATLIKSDTIPTEGWCLVFVDNADVADALGYHELTPAGFPLAKVFVETAIANHEQPSVTASHELVETLVDPWTATCVQDPNTGTIYAYEPADPVEEDTFILQGVAVSNFVTPDWFKGFLKPGGRFDLRGKVRKPFELLAGGYIPVYDPRHQQWTQIFGSAAKAERFVLEDRRGHRSAGRRPIACAHLCTPNDEQP